MKQAILTLKNRSGDSNPNSGHTHIKQPAKRNNIEDSLPGKRVEVQGKSPSHWSGVVESFKYGWLILVGEERRWLPDNSLSEPVCKGRFCIERSAINYVCEAEYD